jgi:hypothetical protein
LVKPAAQASVPEAGRHGRQARRDLPDYRRLSDDRVLVADRACDFDVCLPPA